MRNDKVLSLFLRSGIIILLLLSLLVIVFPVRQSEVFFIPVLFFLLGIGIVILYFVYEIRCLNRPGNLISVFNSVYRPIFFWYLFYFLYLEILAYVQYVFYPRQNLPFTLSADVFLLLSVAPFAIALVYPWFIAQINMSRQTDRDYGSGVLTDCVIFYCRHRLACWITVFVNSLIVCLYIFYSTGKANPGTIGWILASYVDGSFFILLLLIVNPILIICYFEIAEYRQFGHL
jgi:hypothetical protein